MAEPLIVVGAVILFTILVVKLAALERHRQWNCPKCGQTMQKTGNRGGFMWRNTEMHCTSCGNTKWYKPPWPSGGG